MLSEEEIPITVDSAMSVVSVDADVGSSNEGVASSSMSAFALEDVYDPTANVGLIDAGVGSRNKEVASMSALELDNVLFTSIRAAIKMKDA